jgi:23S rRNA pseudouridine2605 synthase
MAYAGTTALQVLAAAGVASRRAAEDLIFAGNVKLNGQVVTAPQTLAHPQQDKVRFRKPVP